MQPKAAKKIGGMTPKKMTGGAPFNFEGTDYEITKDITRDGKLTICVSTAMPGAEVKEEVETMVSGAEAEAAALKARAEAVKDKLPENVTPDNATEEDVKAAESLEGGKKKRKSSKKRKSMKKKGGMKRKSMKVKA